MLKALTVGLWGWLSPGVQNLCIQRADCRCSRDCKKGKVKFYYICPFIEKFAELLTCVMSTHCVPGAVLGAGDAAVNFTKS